MTVKDIQLDSLIITNERADYTIPLDPPLASFRDVRERVVQMDRIAVAGLGRSRVTIKQYLPPKGFHAVVFVACLGTFALFVRKGNLEPGSYLHQELPAFAEFCLRIRGLMSIAVLLHICEATYMTRYG